MLKKTLSIVTGFLLIMNILYIHTSAETNVSNQEYNELSVSYEFAPERAYTQEEYEDVLKTNKAVLEYINVLNARRNLTYYKKLSVTAVKQETSYYCSAATTYMVLSFINGSSPSQSTIASRYGCTPQQGPSTDAITSYINNRISTNKYTYVQIPKSGDYTSSLRNYAMFSLDRSRPIICQLKTKSLIGYDSTKNYSHYVVLYGARNGYSSTDSIDKVSYIDPYDTMTNNQYSLGAHEVDMQKLASAIVEHPAGYIVTAKS